MQYERSHFLLTNLNFYGIWLAIDQYSRFESKVVVKNEVVCLTKSGEMMTLSNGIEKVVWHKYTPGYSFLRICNPTSIYSSWDINEINEFSLQVGYRKRVYINREWSFIAPWYKWFHCREYIPDFNVADAQGEHISRNCKSIEKSSIVLLWLSLGAHVIVNSIMLEVASFLFDPVEVSIDPEKNKESPGLYSSPRDHPLPSGITHWQISNSLRSNWILIRRDVPEMPELSDFLWSNNLTALFRIGG